MRSSSPAAGVASAESTVFAAPRLLHFAMRAAERADSVRGGRPMSEHPDFAEFLRRIRCGDAQAARELVHRYESAIRLAVRTRLTDPALKRQVDAADICQSVLGSFFVRAAAGQYDLAEPAQLLALLVRMAQNKLAGEARFHHRRRRDARLVAGQDEAVERVADGGPAPDQIVAARDLLAAVRAGLSPEERELA